MRCVLSLFACILLAGCSQTAPSPSDSIMKTEETVIKRKGGPSFSSGSPGSPGGGRSMPTPPQAKETPKKKANPVLEQIKEMDLVQAELAKYFHGKWGVMLKNQIRVLKKDIRLHISEDIAIAKIAKYEHWIGFRQWQGDYPYTVAGLQERKAQWQKVEIELPRQLDDCLKQLELWQAINEERLENIEEFISFFSK